MKNNLTKIRKEKGFTGRALADLCGVSATYITQIEAREYNPSLGNAYKIALALGRDVADIWPNTAKIVAKNIKVTRIEL